MAQRITERIRCRTRRTVSGSVPQIGVRTARPSARVIWSTGMLTKAGKAKRSKARIPAVACFWFRHLGRLAWCTWWAASLKVGFGGRRFSA